MFTSRTPADSRIALPLPDMVIGAPIRTSSPAIACKVVPVTAPPKAMSPAPLVVIASADADAIQARELQSDGSFATLAGFLLSKLDHLPRTGETLDWRSFRFEVVDMDVFRIDKVMVSSLPDRAKDPPPR